jgi:hypothetical protein
LAWNMAWVCTRCGFLAFLLSMATFILWWHTTCVMPLKGGL